MDTKAKILDIAMNLNRIGNWAADDFISKKKRIHIFLDETTQSLETLSATSLSKPFQKTYLIFQKEYAKLEKEGKEGPKDNLLWAEDLMTWGNILTHRVKLL